MVFRKLIIFLYLHSVLDKKKGQMSINCMYCTLFSGIMGKQVGKNAFVVALWLARRMEAIRLYSESRRRLTARDASSTATEAVTGRMGSGTSASEIASI